MSFGAYQPEDQVLSSDVLVAPMWSGNTTQLTTFFSWSLQESTPAQGKFYLNVFKDNIELSLSPFKYKRLKHLTFFAQDMSVL